MLLSNFHFCGSMNKKITNTINQLFTFDSLLCKHANARMFSYINLSVKVEKFTVIVNERYLINLSGQKLLLPFKITPVVENMFSTPTDVADMNKYRTAS